MKFEYYNTVPEETSTPEIGKAPHDTPKIIWAGLFAIIVMGLIVTWIFVYIGHRSSEPVNDISDEVFWDDEKVDAEEHDISYTHDQPTQPPEPELARPIPEPEPKYDSTLDRPTYIPPIDPPQSPTPPVAPEDIHTAVELIVHDSTVDPPLTPVDDADITNNIPIVGDIVDIVDIVNND